MLQNATPLRKSAPGPPNSSDEHVSCTAPATENASFQILFKCPMPAIVFAMLHNPHVCSLLTRCTIPCDCLAKRHLNVQKWSEQVVFLTFWPRNVLRATTVSTFSTSQLPKVVRAWCVLYMLTSKCASRHNSVHFSSSQLPRVVRTWCALYILTSKCASRHFFDIATSKSAPKLRCAEVFCIFSIILSSKCTSRHNGVQFFISHLDSWLRTRRFSEPTFRPSGATNHWKNTVFRDFPTFSRTWIFFLLRLSLFWSSSSLTPPSSASHLSILSEVWLLNFLRSLNSVHFWAPFHLVSCADLFRLRPWHSGPLQTSTVRRKKPQPLGLWQYFLKWTKYDLRTCLIVQALFVKFIRPLKVLPTALIEIERETTLAQQLKPEPRFA